ncbi:DUF4097 family beta strand repeat-containing protein [Hydrogenoanaerobacterium sp.]|uniref:DUF4097 family beta strand repeat-containing protein n=1 Tax=Hydrogenoanaerobacterium sp. TaxID=2953763 RepID=UPI0028971449|nr:DUF4097 family beta strand repeat-containing protein [Hydrogenoanaerobacterium sp.]
MKKSTMIVLIVAACMVVLGALLAGTAYAISGGNIGIYWNNSSGWYHGNSYSDDGRVTAQTVDTGAFTSIDADVDFAEVRLIRSDRNYVEYAFAINQPKPICTVSAGGTLQFQQRQHDNRSVFSFFDGIPFGSRGQSYVYIYYRAEQLDFVTVKTSAGDVQLKDLAVKDTLNLEIDFGKLTVSNVSAANINAEVSSGDSRFTDITADGLVFDSDFGKVTFENITTRNFQSNTSSGDTTVLNCRLGNAEFDSDFGRITAEHTTAEGLRVNCDSGDISFSGTFTGITDIDSDFGKVSLSTDVPREQYSIALSTDFGSIHVNNEKFTGSVNQNSGAPNSITIQNGGGSIAVNFQ